MRPDQISALGAVRTFQSASLLVGMNVWDNVHVASLFRSREASDAEAAVDCTARAIAYCGLQDRIHALAESLTIGEQKRVEIARRSEEHTSELQSLMRISYAVFCLKKKQHTT